MKLIFHNHPNGILPLLKQHKRIPSGSGTELQNSLAVTTGYISSYSSSSTKDETLLATSPRSNRSVSPSFTVPPCKHVSFDLDNVVEHPAPTHDGGDVSLGELWYTRSELAAMREIAMQHAAVLAKTAGHWTDPTAIVVDALEHVYNGFCRVQTAADVHRLLMRAPAAHLTSHLVGLDRLLVPRLRRDKVERRQRILRQMQFIQGTSHAVGYQAHGAYDTLAVRLHRASRSLSQPSRLYANYIAYVARRLSDDDEDDEEE